MHDFREAIESAFKIVDKEMSVEYADSRVITGQILTLGIQPLIADALFCIFDISEESRPNIFLELGYALGKSKYVILTSTTLPQKASDISGFGIVIYNSFKELRTKLSDQLPAIIAAAREHNKEVASMSKSQTLLNKGETIQLLELHRASLQDSILPFLDEYSDAVDRNPDFYDYDDVFRFVRDAIKESRNQLKRFKNQKVGDVKKFIEQNFTDFQLGRIIKKEIEPIIKSTKFDTKEKRRKLHRKIMEEERKVFNGFYSMLGDDSEDKDE
jgi:hypothetical protein